MNRQRVILAALLGVLALCLLYAYLAMPRLEKAPPRTTSQRDRVSTRVAEELKSENAQERINFDFLTLEPQEFQGAQRDIFRFGKRAPAQSELPVEAIEVPVAPVMNVAVITDQPSVPFEVVQQSLGNFTFLGFLEKAGEKTVFLSSGGDIFLVKRGEVFGINREFQVDSIDGNLLKVRHSGRDGLVEIPLIEQQKLNAAVSAPARIEPDSGASNQSDPRIFTPKKRMMRPASQETENPFQRIIEKDRPAEEQNSEFPADRGALEEEVNGTNQ